MEVPQMQMEMEDSESTVKIQRPDSYNEQPVSSLLDSSFEVPSDVFTKEAKVIHTEKPFVQDQIKENMVEEGGIEICEKDMMELPLVEKTTEDTICDSDLLSTLTNPLNQQAEKVLQSVQPKQFQLSHQDILFCGEKVIQEDKQMIQVPTMEIESKGDWVKQIKEALVSDIEKHIQEGIGRISVSMLWMSSRIAEIRRNLFVIIHNSFITT